MAEDSEKKRLKEKYPDLSMSVIAPIYEQFGSTSEDILKTLQRDPGEDIKVRGIAEMLPHLDPDYVREMLRKNHGDAEATTLALLSAPQAPQQARRRPAAPAAPAAAAAATSPAPAPTAVTPAAPPPSPEAPQRTISPPVGSEEWVRNRQRDEAERKRKAEDDKKKRAEARATYAEAAVAPAPQVGPTFTDSPALQYEKEQRKMASKLRELEERETRLAEALAEAQSRLSEEGQRRVDSTLADAHRVEVMRRELEGMRAERDRAAQAQREYLEAQRKLQESAQKAAAEATAQAMQTALLAKELEETQRQRDNALKERQRAMETAERAAEALRKTTPTALVAHIDPEDPRTVVAEWSIPETAGNTEPSDWIALFIHNREFKYTAYAPTKGERKGTYKFPGLQKGYYDVRYFRGGASSYAYHSSPVLVGEAVDGLRAEYATRRVTASWARVAGKGDWVGLYSLRTRSNRQYITYQYVDGRTSAEFEAPREPGDYEVRYFYAGPGVLARGFLPFSGRAQVVVPNEDLLSATLSNEDGKVTIKWACPSHVHSSRDWVGLYAQGADSTAYLASAYTSDGAFLDSTTTDAGVVVIDLSRVRNRDAVSEVRFFSAAAGKYTPLMKAPITVA